VRQTAEWRSYGPVVRQTAEWRSYGPVVRQTAEWRSYGPVVRQTAEWKSYGPVVRQTAVWMNRFSRNINSYCLSDAKWAAISPHKHIFELKPWKLRHRVTPTRRYLFVKLHGVVPHIQIVILTLTATRTPSPIRWPTCVTEYSFRFWPRRHHLLQNNAKLPRDKAVERERSSYSKCSLSAVSLRNVAIDWISHIFFNRDIADWKGLL
jgi:hypothetical protein